MKKVNLKEVLEQSKDFAKKLGNLLVLVVALFAGGIIGYYYYHFSQKKEATVELEKVRGIEQTSVAINERSELMIIDRTTGKYTIYDDSVGTAIFSMYASKMYLRQTVK